MTLSARRLAGDSAIYATAAALGKAAALISVPILTRALGAEGYGLADLASSLAATLALIARFGGEVPTARLAAHASSVGERRLVMGSLVLATSGVSLLLVLLLIPAIPLLVELWRAPDQVWLAACAVLLIPLGAVQVALISVVRLENRPKAVAGLATIDLLAQMVFAVVLVVLGLGPLGVVLGYVIGSTIGAIAAGAVARRFLDLRIGWQRGIDMLRAGLPYLPAFAAFVLADQLARLITVDAIGPAAVGHLALAIRIASVMSLAVSAFSFAWAPMALGMSHSPQTALALHRALVWYLVIALLASTILGALAPQIVELAAGTSYGPTAVAAPGLIWAAALSGAFFILTTAAGVTQRGRAVVIAALLGASLQIILAARSVESAGLLGISASSLAGRAAGLVVLGFALRDFLPMRDYRVPALVIIGSCIALALPALDAAEIEHVAIRTAVGSVAVSVALIVAWQLLARLRRRQSPPNSDCRNPDPEG